MERNPLSDPSVQDATSPPRYRLSWDTRGLVLEERSSGTDYTVRASSAITFPPTPMAAVHPELGKLVERTLTQFMRGWLHGADSVAVAFSPPWGNAWKIPVGGLDGDDVREHVEWELQQRLKDSLQGHIYAWNRVNGEAYAVVIRPELLSFWENLLRERGIELNSINITAGLVDPEIEREADLLPLLHLWQEKGARSPDSEDYSIPVPESVPGELEGELGTEEESEVNELLGDLERERGTSRRWAPMLAVIVLFLVVGAAWWFREPLLALLPERTAEPVAEQEVSPPQQEQLAGAGEAALEMGAAANDAPPAAGEPASGATDPITSSGQALESVFALASTHDIDLNAVILQGDQLLVEGSGQDAAFAGWRSSLAGLSSMTYPSRGGSYELSGFTLAGTHESELTVTQFDRWANELGMTVRGPQLYAADRAALDRLFSRMESAGARPWRLSIHASGTDGYAVMMLP